MKMNKTKPTEKLKVKLVKDKPNKVYAVNIESSFYIKDFIDFLYNTKDKKLDVIVNGKLFKLATAAAKNKFVEGLKLSQSILGNNKPQNEVTVDTVSLKKEVEEAKKIKELCS